MGPPRVGLPQAAVDDEVDRVRLAIEERQQADGPRALIKVVCKPVGRGQPQPPNAQMLTQPGQIDSAVRGHGHPRVALRFSGMQEQILGPDARQVRNQQVGLRTGLDRRMRMAP